MSYGAHKGIKLTIAMCLLLIGLAMQFQTQTCHRLETIGGSNDIGKEFDILLSNTMTHNIGDDKGKILLSNNFLLVAKFYDTVRNEFCFLTTKFKTKFFKVLKYIRLTRSLTQSIFTLSGKTFRQQIIHIKTCLVVTIGMHTSHLGKDVLTYYRFVGRDNDTGTCLHQMRYLSKLFLVDMCAKCCLVGKYCLHTRQRSIACTLTKSVHGSMYAFASCLCRSQDICNSKIIIVVGMKVKMHIWIVCHHLTDIQTNLHRIENTQCIGQHIALYRCILQTIHQSIYIVGRILYAIRPVLEIDIDINTLLSGICHNLAYVLNMLLHSLAQLSLAMTA